MICEAACGPESTGNAAFGVTHEWCRYIQNDVDALVFWVDRRAGSVLDGAWLMPSNESNRHSMRMGVFMDPGLISGGDFPLSKEHCMLLRMRDTLYEGSWEDFVSDLTARLRGEPHVFATVPSNPEMRATIEAHLSLIEEMRTWEATTGRALSPDLSQAGES